jgi:hypothetical protein
MKILLLLGVLVVSFTGAGVAAYLAAQPAYADCTGPNC